MFSVNSKLFCLGIGFLGLVGCGPYLSRSTGSSSVAATVTMSATPNNLIMASYMGCATTVTITNTTAGTSTGSLSITETDALDCISLSNDLCTGQSLVPTGTCTIDVSYTGNICADSTVTVSSSLGQVSFNASYDGSACPI